MTHTIQVCENAHNAYLAFKNHSLEQKSSFLRYIANDLLKNKNEIINSASHETNLSTDRIEIELNRTHHQLLTFANGLIKGTHFNASIDVALPDRTSMPRPDIRKMNLPIGPVLVFGASNFPLAYSTIGGDTVSALAAGCSVIYKVHPSHPKTSLLIEKIILQNIIKHQLPSHLFQAIVLSDFEEVKKLVINENIKGVGFTGSYKGGMAIYGYAQERKNPIPVFCEMGSTNPVFLLPNALTIKAKYWADKFSESILASVGQFCTSPGIFIGIKGTSLTEFTNTLSHNLSAIEPKKMLSNAIFKNYCDRARILLTHQETEVILQPSFENDIAVSSGLIKISYSTFLDQDVFQEEVFGPFAIIVECEHENDFYTIVNNLQGQLTTSIIAESNDENCMINLLNLLDQKIGRIIMNGVPTGVEVVDSMVHGGGAPSTTDSRYTAVGFDSIYRWMKPTCYQNFDEHLLPSELKNKNQQGIVRKINGKFGFDDVSWNY